MTNPTVMSYAELQGAYRKNGESHREAIDNLANAATTKAQANHDHRKAYAVAYTKHRNAGKGVAESEVLAKADSAHFELQRDMADADLKRYSAEVELYKNDRATLRQLAEHAREEGG